ncbi:MAG: hypothetical protein OXH70_10100 [Acidobacteria bacterium]|nr:hypothetical protein [Acidobacteriota bacterium]
MPATESKTDFPALNEDWIAWRARVDETLRHVATKEDLANLREALTWRILLAMGGFATIVTVLDRLLP